MRNLLQGALFASVFVLLVSCQTTPVNDFGKIKNDMTKDDVLDVLGSPSRTERVDGKEKWAYRFWTGDDHNIETLRQVTFFNGHVVSSGEDVEEIQRLKEIQQEDADRVEKRRRMQTAPVTGAPPPEVPSMLTPAESAPKEDTSNHVPVEEDFVEVKGHHAPIKEIDDGDKSVEEAKEVKPPVAAQPKDSPQVN